MCFAGLRFELGAWDRREWGALPMKSANVIQLDKSWWKKEQPAGLKKSAAAFEKALDEYAKAAQAILKADRAGGYFENTLRAIEKAAKDVIAEAKDLEKKTADRKEKDDLKNTIAVMDKPLAALMASERKRAEALENDEEEGGIKDPKEYGAYLKSVAGKLKKGQMNFAIGLPSNDPAEMRMLVHRSTKGKGLVARLKKEIGAKKFTFGVAGSAAFAESQGDQASGQTLVLDVQGKMIPGLAKRLRGMFKAAKFGTFSKVRLLQGGKEIPDEGGPDEAVGQLDMDDQADELDTIEADDAQENADAEKFWDLREKLIDRIVAAADAAEYDNAVKIEEAWNKIETLAETDPTAALAKVPAYLKMMAALSAGGKAADADAPDAPPPPPPPPDNELKILAERLRGTVGRAKAALAARPALKDQLQKALAGAKEALDAKDADRCRTILDAIDKSLAEAPPPEPVDLEPVDPDRPLPPVSPVAFQRSRIQWLDAKRKMEAELEKLRSSVAALAADDAQVDAIMAATDDLVGEFSAFGTRLEDVLDDITNTEDGPDRIRMRKEAAKVIEAYGVLLDGPFFSRVDSNPFGSVAVAVTARNSLAMIRKTLV